MPSYAPSYYQTKCQPHIEALVLHTLHHRDHCMTPAHFPSIKSSKILQLSSGQCLTSPTIWRGHLLTGSKAGQIGQHPRVCHQGLDVLSGAGQARECVQVVHITEAFVVLRIVKKLVFDELCRPLPKWQASLAIYVPWIDTAGGSRNVTRGNTSTGCRDHKPIRLPVASGEKQRKENGKALLRILFCLDRKSVV